MTRRRTSRIWLTGLAAAVLVARASAQEQASVRTAILVAEDRRAPAPRDLATIRAGLHSRDAETARIAVRALGRLERPELVPDIVALLKSPLPEIRAEAANAVGQAAQGWKEKSPGIDTAALPAIARLAVEAQRSVRAALCQTIGRLPYTTPEQVQRAEAALVGALAHDESVEGRLGVAQGLEALIRLRRRLSAPSAQALARLDELAAGAGINGAARVRRVALEALVTAGAITDEVVVRGLADRDAQVRRLAVKATAGAGLHAPAYEAAERALADESPLVRIEALRVAWPPALAHDSCPSWLKATADHDPEVALVAIDQLRSCGSPETVGFLERTVNDLSTVGSPRGWHRTAHAIVALAAAAPDTAKTTLTQLTNSRIWQLRLYGARAAVILEDVATLERLARDPDDNVCEAAIEGLSRLAKHDADAAYITALGRQGNQVLRAAARALTAAPPPPAAVPALQAALQRLTTEGRDNSHDARAAIAAALQALGVKVPAARPAVISPQVNAADLRRLASARARLTIRGVGIVELALFTTQAPATVLRFARLAEAGYYNGLTFHRVVPNFVIQGGSPGANEYVGDASFMRDEVGLWPHVRGAVGISTRGRDTGDAQIFIDLVDNPRLDHDFTVFAQVLSGMDVVDAILEGDVIDRIEIVAGP